MGKRENEEDKLEMAKAWLVRCSWRNGILNVHGSLALLQVAWLGCRRVIHDVKGNNQILRADVAQKWPHEVKIWPNDYENVYFTWMATSGYVLYGQAGVDLTSMMPASGKNDGCTQRTSQLPVLTAINRSRRCVTCKGGQRLC